MNIACLIARTVSKRLPLKILRNIYENYSMIDFIISRIKFCSNVDKIVICTSTSREDDILEDISIKHDIDIYRGSEKRVIERMMDVGEKYNAKNLIRITADNVLTSYEYIDFQIDVLIEKNLDYVRLINVPIGSTAEIISMEAIKKCYKISDPDQSEYLMLYLFDPQNFRCGVVDPVNSNWSNLSLTVDTDLDLAKIRTLLKNATAGIKIKLKEIVETCAKNNIDIAINNDHSIKMPHGKTINFSDFQEMMNQRISSSTQFDFVE